MGKMPIAEKTKVKALPYFSSLYDLLFVGFVLSILNAFIAFFDRQEVIL